MPFQHRLSWAEREEQRMANYILYFGVRALKRKIAWPVNQRHILCPQRHTRGQLVRGSHNLCAGMLRPPCVQLLAKEISNPRCQKSSHEECDQNSLQSRKSPPPENIANAI